MKFSLLIFAVEIISVVYCDRSYSGGFGYRSYGREGFPSKGHYRKKPHSFPGSPFAAPFSKPLPRPHTFLIPPAVPTVASGYILHTGQYPPTTAITQTYHGPAVSGFRMKGYPRYALSPVRQYVPHNYPVHGLGAVIPPKMLHMQSGSYSTMSTMPYASSTPMHYSSWKDQDHSFDSDAVEYYSHSGESNEDDEEDEEEDDLNIDRKGSAVEAEKRHDHDMPFPVETLMSVVEAQNGNHDSNFLKKKGISYGDEHKSKKGYKTSKGHQSETKFNKGEKGHHDNEVQKKEYDEEGAKKSDHHDEKEKHGSHHEQDHGEKKGEFDEKKKYKKGQKSKGYHNVFHKDEFIKDHTFYDDLDQSGHYKKFEEEHKKHKKDSGKKKKGQHHDSASKGGHQGHHGHYAKGHHDDGDKGYEKKHGHEEHYANEQHHKKKGGDAQKHDFDYLKGY